MPSSSDRFHTVHFRTAMNALNRVLRDWTSFVLLENHSYIRFLERYCGSKPWAERCFKYLSHIYFQSRIALFTFTFFNCIVLYSIVFCMDHFIQVSRGLDILLSLRFVDFNCF